MITLYNTFRNALSDCSVVSLYAAAVVLSCVNPAYGFNRPANPPAPGGTEALAGELLVVEYRYDGVGFQHEVTGNAGMTTRTEYDALGRPRQVVENYDDGVAGGPSGEADIDRVTSYAYNAGGQITVQTADLPGTSDDQLTYYVYSGDLSTPGDVVPNHGYLRGVVYPDAGAADRAAAVTLVASGTGDFVGTTYYADGSLHKRTDQRGVVLEYAYDDAGRRSSQAVTAGTPEGDLRVGYTYTSLGQLDVVTTYDNAAGSGGETSEVDYAYNGLQQLVSEAQDHQVTYANGVPTVSYAYDDAASGNVFTKAHRLDTTTYPNGRVVHTLYDATTDTPGSSGWGAAGIDGALSRPNGLADDNGSGGAGNTLVAYAHMGNGATVVKELPGALVRMDRAEDGTPGGDYLPALDRFGRITRLDWDRYAPSTKASSDNPFFDLRHGYDDASNRLYTEREDNPYVSEAYDHDDLHRLSGYDAGHLDGTQSSIEDGTRINIRGWSLDALGNAQTVGTIEDPDPTYTNPLDDNDPFLAATYNKANEYLTRSVQGSRRYVPGDDFEDASTASYWGSVGGSFTISGGVMSLSGTGTKIQIYNTTGYGTGRGVGSTYLQVKCSGVSGSDSAGLVLGYSGVTSYTRFVYKADGTLEIRSGNSLVTSGNATGALTGPVVLTVRRTERYTVCRVQELGFGNNSGEIVLASASLPYIIADPLPVGLCSSGGSITFDDFVCDDGSRPSPLGASWENHANNIYIDPSYDALRLDARLSIAVTGGTDRRPALLRGVRGKRFRADFKVIHDNDIDQKLIFSFDADAPETADYLVIPIKDGFSGNGLVPSGYRAERGSAPTLLSATTDATDALPVEAGESFWVRVESNGTDVFVYHATSEAGLTNADPCFETSSSTDQFVLTGGQLGFAAHTDFPLIDEVKVYLDTNEDLDFDDVGELQHHDTFDVDTDRYTTQSLAHDDAGNLIYDGTFSYVYDAWNRLVAVRKAVSSTVDGATTATMAYDGLGRMIVETVENAGSFDHETHLYYNGQQRIETRNGSGLVLKQHVWGLDYIDELIEVAVNQDPVDLSPDDESDCEWRFVAVHNAQYNVLGLITAPGNMANGTAAYGHAGGAGTLVEWYAYTPYGQRTVYSRGFYPGDFNLNGTVDLLEKFSAASMSSGASFTQGDADGDGDVDAADVAVVDAWGNFGATDRPTAARVILATGTTGLGLNDVGHQGLFHGGAIGLGLVYNRARMLHTTLGRFVQRDPLGYVDGLSRYAAYQVFREGMDPSGLAFVAFDGTGNEPGQTDAFAGGRTTQTNVRRLFLQSDDPNNLYFEGVGTSVNSQARGGATGNGGKSILDDAWEEFATAINGSDDDFVDIIGFSRGSALALEFSNMISDRNGKRPSASEDWTPLCREVEIRFMGLFDTVGSFGLAGNHINRGYRLRLPSEVGEAVHAMAIHENRHNFPVTRLSGAHEVWFAGVHSNVGGGYSNRRLSDITLMWMYHHAKAAGVEIGRPSAVPNYQNAVIRNPTLESNSMIAAEAVASLIYLGSSGERSFGARDKIHITAILHAVNGGGTAAQQNKTLNAPPGTSTNRDPWR